MSFHCLMRYINRIVYMEGSMYCRKCGKKLQHGVVKFCPNCGTKVIRPPAPLQQSAQKIGKSTPGVVPKAVEKFCPKCGSLLNERGKCPNCSVFLTPVIKKKAKKMLSIIIALLSVYTVTLITFSTLVYFDKLNIPFLNDMFIIMGLKEPAVRIPEVSVSTESEAEVIKKDKKDDAIADKILTDRYNVTLPDAEEYFKNNSTIITVLNVRDIDTVLSESEAYSVLTERGFDEYAIVTDYFMNGEFSDDMEISSNSLEKHPIYKTYHMTPDGDLWQILIVNNAIYANPLSYNIKYINEIPVAISETDEITSYDSVTNKYYINNPNETIMKVKKIKRIESATLNQLTREEIDQL